MEVDVNRLIAEGKITIDKNAHGWWVFRADGPGSYKGHYLHTDGEWRVSTSVPQNDTGKVIISGFFPTCADAKYAFEATFVKPDAIICAQSG